MPPQRHHQNFQVTKMLYQTHCSDISGFLLFLVVVLISIFFWFGWWLIPLFSSWPGMICDVDHRTLKLMVINSSQERAAEKQPPSFSFSRLPSSSSPLLPSPPSTGDTTGGANCLWGRCQSAATSFVLFSKPPSYNWHYCELRNQNCFFYSFSSSTVSYFLSCLRMVTSHPHMNCDPHWRLKKKIKSGGLARGSLANQTRRGRR